MRVEGVKPVSSAVPRRGGFIIILMPKTAPAYFYKRLSRCEVSSCHPVSISVSSRKHPRDLRFILTFCIVPLLNILRSFVTLVCLSLMHLKYALPTSLKMSNKY